jgi:hypothetical protein
MAPIKRSPIDLETRKQQYSSTETGTTNAMSSNADSMPKLSSMINQDGLELKNPDHAAEVLRQLVKKTFEQLKSEDWELVNWSANGKKSHRHDCTWSTDALIELIVSAHFQMSQITSHLYRSDMPVEDLELPEFNCDPMHLADSSAHPKEQMNDLLEHFDALLAFMSGPDAPDAAPSAMLYLHHSLIKFLGSWRYHDRCLKPLWHFLLELTSILHDLQLANSSEKDFHTVHNLLTPREYFAKVNRMLIYQVDPAEDEQNCPICFDCFATDEEILQHKLFEALPFNLRAGEENSIENPDIADFPHRTPCGHLISFYCFKTTIVKSIRAWGTVGSCPMCRTPLVRSHSKCCKVIEDIGEEADFITERRASLGSGM